MESRQGLEMIVAIGRDKGTGDRPIGKQAVVNQVEGFGLVAKVMFAPWPVRGFGVRVRWLGLIRTRIEDVSRVRVTRGGQATGLGAVLGIARTAFLARLASRTLPLSGRQKAAVILVPAAHVGAGADQLTVRGQTHPPFRRVAREARGSRDDAISH